MTLGEKIRNARIEARMTQSELAGDVITRNMLSKVENGSVNPSVKTLNYIASRLKLPAGYFLVEADSADRDTAYRVGEVRRLFSEKKYDECLMIFLVYNLPEDSENNYYRAVCFSEKGFLSFKKGILRDAEEYFGKALHYADNTGYPVENIRFKCDSYLFRIDQIKNESSFRDKKKYLGSRKLSCEYERIFAEKYILSLIWEHEYSAAEYLNNELFTENSVSYSTVSAILKSEDGDYDGATNELRQLADDENVALPERFVLLDYLEEMYAEKGNYTDAYYCARKKAEMKNLMLS